MPTFKLTRSFREFSGSQEFSGILLIACTILSLILANSPVSFQYDRLLNSEHIFTIGSENISISITHFINEALMAVFFLLIGLEMRRELTAGELSSFQKASLPVIAAFGGMIFPAIIFAAINYNSPTMPGWGIPMATDIAFAIGILALVGNKIPASLKVLLIAIAVADDLGAVIVIAIFYSAKLNYLFLVSATGIVFFMLMLNKLRVKNIPVYLGIGIILWFCIYKSGIHSTISGVLLAFVIPYNKSETRSPLIRIEHFLQKPVNFFIMPLFALVNTAILFNSSLHSLFSDSLSIGIITGLLIGKPLGICLFIAIALKFKIGILPGQVNWNQLIGIGFLGGIGFTMSLFISLLAFQDPVFISSAKISVLLASTIAGCVGFIILKGSRKQIQ